MTLKTRLSKLEASILPEVRPPKFVVISEDYRDGEEAWVWHENATSPPIPRTGAPLVIFLRKMLGRRREGGGRPPRR